MSESWIERETGSSPRGVAIVGAASSIGIRPYEEGGRARALDQAPSALRGLGFVATLRADDLGDVTPPPYRDFVRPPSGVRNEVELIEYTHALGVRVREGLSGGRRVIVLGGDCSIILGSLLGVSAVHPRVGLVYVDAHADFATPEESMTGSAASMCLAMAVGRGDSALARLRGSTPLVEGENVVVIGRRDEEEFYGQEALGAYGVLDLPDATLRDIGSSAAASRALQRVGREELDGFWVHLDADVIDPEIMPAVDSPEPGGLGIDELVELLSPLLRHPRALGMQVTIYDPSLDPGRTAGRALATLLEQSIGTGQGVGGRRRPEWRPG